MSPILFYLFMDRILRETLDKFEGGGIEIAYRTDGGLSMNYRVKLDGTHKIKASMYADDLALLGTSSSELQQMVNAFHDTCMKWGTKINTDKTKILTIGAEEANISIAGCVLENVSEFCYLGSTVTKSGDSHLEVVERIQKLVGHSVLGNVECSQTEDLARTQTESL